MPGKHSNEAVAETERILEILHKWGIHTLGQLVALDKQQLAARLGPRAVQMRERASGKSMRPLKLVQLPESFEESFEFEHEIESAEPLLFMLRRFLEQLAVRLSTIYLVAQELTLRIHFTDGAAEGDKAIYERSFKIPQPTNDVDLLFRMLQTHLENFKSKQPIVAVSLQADPAKPGRQQFGLFETPLRNPHQLYETLGRLSALLGPDRVGTPAVEETHRPDVFRMESFAWAVASPVPSGKSGQFNSAPDALRTAHTTARPALRRFRPPLSASVFYSQDRHLQTENISGTITDQRGPYLLSGNWWDEKLWDRAEWDLQLENGELIRAHEGDGAWKMDGVYD